MSFRSCGVALLSEFLNGSSFVTELGFFMWVGIYEYRFFPILIGRKEVARINQN